MLKPFLVHKIKIGYNMYPILLLIISLYLSFNRKEINMAMTLEEALSITK